MAFITSDVPSGPEDVANTQTDRYTSLRMSRAQPQESSQPNAARRKQRGLSRGRRKNKLRGRQ